MNWNLIGNLFVALLFFGPGLLLLVRFLKGKRFPWWLAIGLSVLLVWGSTFGASISTTKDLTAQIESYEARGLAPPEELLEDWASDAHGVFALLLGWAFSIPVLAFWLLVYGIAHGIRGWIRKRRSPSNEGDVPPADPLPEAGDIPDAS